MNTGEARALLLKYVAAVAYIAIERPDGSQGIGTATHVGEGVYVTARHVVEGNKILEVGSTESTYIRLAPDAESTTHVVEQGERWPAHRVNNERLTIVRGPFFHDDDRVDLAAIVVEDADPATPWVPLGSHLDDWIGGTDFVLSKAVLMGYPPVPMTRRPYLVATRAEVISQVDYTDTPHVHWILSSVARGGFSGAMVIGEADVGVGVVGRSAVVDEAPPELGFMSATSIEPVYHLLANAKILPSCQADGWDDLWNADDTWLELPAASGPGRVAVAGVEVFDDGRVMKLTVRVHTDPDLLVKAVTVARTALVAHDLDEVATDRQVSLQIVGYHSTAAGDVERTAETVLTFLEGALPGTRRWPTRRPPATPS